MASPSNHRGNRVGPKRLKRASRELIAEEPLSIRVEGNPYSVVMRTPGRRTGPCRRVLPGRGAGGHPRRHRTTIGVCDDGETNVVTVTLSPARRSAGGRHLERRGFISQTSCGICGKEIVEDLYQQIRPLETARPDRRPGGLERMETMIAHQPLRRRTRAAHAALFFDAGARVAGRGRGRGPAQRPGQGRRQAFSRTPSPRSRLAGLVFPDQLRTGAKSRPGADAGYPGPLRPTTLAVDLATGLSITLATHLKTGGLTIYTFPERLAFLTRRGGAADSGQLHMKLH